MRIGVDATSWVNRRGFGRFTRNVVPRLVAAHADAEYVLYIDEQSVATAALPAGAETRPVPLSEQPARAAAAGSRRSLRDLLRLTATVRADDLDAFLFPSVYTYFPVVGVPTIVGIHDAIVHELPALTLATTGDRLAWRAKELVALRTAARIFTVSEASRTELEHRLGVPPQRVAVVPEAADDVFCPRGAAEIDAARRRVGLGASEDFFVFVGGVSPHKNVETLVRAYAAFVGAGSEPRLLVVGDLTTDSYLSSAHAVQSLVGELGLGDRVLFPGYVEDDALAALYSAATAVVIPSLAEGFGLPAVEGAACRAPLILSDLPAHRETLDGAALFFSPRDVDELVRALVRVAADGGLRADLAERAYARAQAYSWDAAVAPLRTLIEDAATAGRRAA